MRILKKTFIVVLSGILAYVVIVVSGLYYKLSPFYQDCIKIKEGQNKELMLGIMKPYINNSKYEVISESKKGKLGTTIPVEYDESINFSKKSGFDWQCKLLLNKNNVVFVDVDFE